MATTPTIAKLHARAHARPLESSTAAASVLPTTRLSVFKHDAKDSTIEKGIKRLLFNVTFTQLVGTR
jgi:hypothetical protein